MHDVLVFRVYAVHAAAATVKCVPTFCVSERRAEPWNSGRCCLPSSPPRARWCRVARVN
jgi:hypothetical protein